MKHYQLAILNLFVLVASACGENKNSLIDQQTIQNSFSSEVYQKQSDNILSIIGKGFSSIENMTKNNCLDNTSYEFIPDGRSQISFYNNISSSELNEILNINTNGKINSLQGNIFFDSGYLSNLKASELSSTVTLISSVTKGVNSLIKNNNSENGFKINKFYSSIFEKNKSEFIKICGDTVVEKQKLSAYLIITAKLDFKNKESKISFENKINGDKNIFNEINSFADFKYISSKDKINNDIKITISGMQLGGDFIQLQKILKKNVCNLNQIEQCNQMFETINEYFSNEFQNQLDLNDNSSWITSSIKTIPYSQVIIVDESGEYFSDKFNFGLDYANFSDKLKIVKEENKKLNSAVKNILAHNSHVHLSNEQVNYYNKNLINSEINLNVIDDYFSDCQSLKSLDNCLVKYLKEVKEAFLPIDSRLMNETIGKHVRSYHVGLTDIVINKEIYKKRDIDERLFSNEKNLKFVLLDPNRNEVRNEKISIYCQKRYVKKLENVNKGFWLTFILNAWPTIYTIISKAVNEEYYLLDNITNMKKSDIILHDIKSYCGKEAKIFFASKPDSLISKIEIWEQNI
ncbi:hypothetical protein ACWNT8_08325 [Pigmentibacter ruber]